MQFFVTRTGLEVFDTARAWGLAVLLNALTETEVDIQDWGWAFVVTPLSAVHPNAQLTGSTWNSLFVAQDVDWRGVFVTYKSQEQQGKAGEVKECLSKQWHELCKELSNPTNTVKFGSGETLPGGLDPTAFKGLRHASRARYAESQLRVPKGHWALACLGMATCGTYHFIREATQWKTLVLLPAPQSVRFDYFRDVQHLMRPKRLYYLSVQNAAAHYAVHLAEQVRKRAAAGGSLQDFFYAILYFMLIRTGQQTKPSQGSKLNLAPFTQIIQRDPHKSQAVLEWLDYCFRLGTTQGSDELALAATELVMRWDLDAYERMVRVLSRFVAKKRMKIENLPSEETLEEVMRYVTT